MKILIVDDDPINQKYLSAMLTGYGEIDTAQDGLQAVELIEREMDSEEPYNIIFLDIMMPKMDGHETLQTIRKMEQVHGVSTDRRLNVIMVTALGDKENVLSAFSEGCEYYLVKPFRQNKVIELMDELGYKKKASEIN